MRSRSGRSISLETHAALGCCAAKILAQHGGGLVHQHGHERSWTAVDAERPLAQCRGDRLGRDDWLGANGVS
jgi:hypothetical protein